MQSTPDLTETAWRKSSYSGSDGGDCIEIASVQGVVAVRDSKNPDGSALSLTPAAFAAFVAAAVCGEFVWPEGTS